jgi:hypothetical protein
MDGADSQAADIAAIFTVQRTIGQGSGRIGGLKRMPRAPNER